jgi:hypothetical protein
MKTLFENWRRYLSEEERPISPDDPRVLTHVPGGATCYKKEDGTIYCGSTKINKPKINKITPEPKKNTPQYSGEVWPGSKDWGQDQIEFILRTQMNLFNRTATEDIPELYYRTLQLIYQIGDTATEQEADSLLQNFINDHKDILNDINELYAIDGPERIDKALLYAGEASTDDWQANIVGTMLEQGLLHNDPRIDVTSHTI